MDKLIPVLLALAQNETVRNMVLGFLTKPQSQAIAEIQSDVVAIKLDKAMRARVQEYQSKNGLDSDGVPGPKTLTSMLDKVSK